ncbi:MAG: LysR family transcriptional regulator [Proteobacteria bacterium]|nr:LysR family transcriptional regulator [Pseudomonadota bacterium]
MDWDDIKLFLALMRTGTVRAAAARLGVSHSTVARRIDALEKKITVRLFDRIPTGYVLTPVGEDMLNVAEQVETELEGLERRILGHDHKLSGRIRVTMVDALATNVLMPHLAEFAQKYPEIDLEVEVTYEAANLDYREADVALRFAQNPPEHLIGRRLVTCATAPYASQDYLDHHDLKDPAMASWIGFGTQNPFPKWVKESKFPNIPAKGQIVSLLVQLEACKAGMGMGMLPCFLGEPEPTLRRLSPGKPDPNFELWLLTHRDMRTNARIRVFSDFIASAIKGLRNKLEWHEPTTGPGPAA